MKVEAIKQENGVFIPMNDMFRAIPSEKMLLDIEILEPGETNEYAVFDQLIGICETGKTDASVNHDTILYTRRTSQ